MAFYNNSAGMVPLPDDEPALSGAAEGTTPFYANSQHIIADENLPGGADRKHGVSPPPSSDRTAGQPSSQQTPGQSDGPAVELPDAVKALRESPERQMFSAEKQYNNVFQRGRHGDSLAGEDPETVAALDREAAAIYSDFRLSNPEAQTVHDVFSTEVTDDLADQWRSESEAYIARLGPDGQAKLDLARQLVARDPRVAEMLKGPHGDNPAIVRLVIEKAQAEKRDGRL